MLAALKPQLLAETALEVSHLREKGDALDPEERRERASRAALEMAALLGDDGFDDDDDDNPENLP